jgi:phenol/toluene 2-monooxygenase (NADH) P1/A1
MQIDLRTITITPLRQTFGHLARRMGADKPASRYMEATMDLQPVENFHYRPTWDPAHEIFDASLTAVVMKDWYALKDPRQYYYGAWTLARSRMQETAEGDFDLVEELGLAGFYPDAGCRLAAEVLIPLRHVAYASNINNSYIGAYAYGIAMSQAATYASMDQLGVAQYLTRLAMAFGDIDGLAAGKAAWLNAPDWQDLRCFVEDMMVMKDWFELFVAQNFALDGLMYPIFFERLNDRMSLSHGATIAMLTRFPREWYADNSKWVDAVIKTAAAESGDNKELLTRWARGWRDRAAASLNPVVFKAFGDDAESVMDEVLQQFNTRAAKLGIAL